MKHDTRIRLSVTEGMIDRAVIVSFPWAYPPQSDYEDARRVKEGKKPRDWAPTRQACRDHTRRVLTAALSDNN